MNGVTVCEFQMDYTELNLNLQKKYPKNYEVRLFYAMLAQAQKGFRHKRINKVTGKGTSVKYIPMTESDLPQVRDYFFKKAEEINEKYGTDIQLTKTE